MNEHWNDPNRPLAPDCHERGHRGGCGRGRHGGSMTHEQYDALPIEEKLFHNLHELTRSGRPGCGRGGQGRILTILADRERISQRELMEILGIQSGSLSETLGKLEDAGYIRREQREDDRRGMDVCITESGREAAGQRRKEWASVRARSFAALDETEKETLLALLEKAAEGARPQPPECDADRREGEDLRGCRRGGEPPRRGNEYCERHEHHGCGRG